LSNVVGSLLRNHANAFKKNGIQINNAIEGNLHWKKLNEMEKYRQIQDRRCPHHCARYDAEREGTITLHCNCKHPVIRRKEREKMSKKETEHTKNQCVHKSERARGREGQGERGKEGSNRHVTPSKRNNI